MPISRKMLGTALGTIALLVAASGPSRAQSPSQTAEGAHQFLKLTMPQNVYRGGAYYEKVRDVERNFQRIRTEIFDPKITAWTPRGKCVTHVAVGAMTMNAAYLQSRRDGVVILNPAEFDVDWSELVHVRAADGDVFLQWKGSPRESMVLLHSPDLATRVAYAMDFLHRACDPAAATGF